MLADRIMQAVGVESLSPLRKLLPKATRIDVSNVSDHYFAGTDQEVFSLGKDFPNSAPPFDLFWLEARSPAEVWNKKGRVAWPVPIRSWGALVNAKDLDTATAFERAIMQQAGIAAHDTKWLMTMFLVVEPESGLDRRSLWTSWTVSVRADGTTRGDGQGDVFGLMSDSLTAMAKKTMQGTTMSAELSSAIRMFTDPLLLSLSFMHCKNVSVQSVDPPEQSARAVKRHGGIPLMRYHTLDIEPMKKVLREEGHAQQTGLKNALHICRGHFSEYGASFGKGKLFGKHEGRFWMPMHTRGNASAGVVVKDYKVKVDK